MPSAQAKKVREMFRPLACLVCRNGNSSHSAGNPETRRARQAEYDKLLGQNTTIQLDRLYWRRLVHEFSLSPGMTWGSSKRD
jgi:hypothetical protein